MKTKVIGTSHPTLGRALAGDKVTFEFAVQIAPFLHLSKEAAVRLAGLLPPVPESTAQSEQLLHLFEQMDEAKKEDLLLCKIFVTKVNQEGGVKACPKCETINNDNASFCIKCSESLSPAPASQLMDQHITV